MTLKRKLSIKCITVVVLCISISFILLLLNTRVQFFFYYYLYRHYGSEYTHCKANSNNVSCNDELNDFETFVKKAINCNPKHIESIDYYIYVLNEKNLYKNSNKRVVIDEMTKLRDHADGFYYYDFVIAREYQLSDEFDKAIPLYMSIYNSDKKVSNELLIPCKIAQCSTPNNSHEFVQYQEECMLLQRE